MKTSRPRRAGRWLATAALVFFSIAIFVAPALPGAPQPAAPRLLADYLFGPGAATRSPEGAPAAPPLRLEKAPPAGAAAGPACASLDAGVFRGPQWATGEEFSVAVWLRPWGYGRETRHPEWPNGMVAHNGSGYYDGWRLVLDHGPALRPEFELGAPGGSVMVGGGSLAPGQWHLLVATVGPAPAGGAAPAAAGAARASFVARLYVDGRLAAARPVPAPVPPNGGCGVGNGDYGVGSLKMDVARVRVYAGALGAAAARRMFLGEGYPDDAPTPAARARALDGRARLWWQDGRPAVAARLWEKLAADAAAPALARRVAGLCRLAALGAAGAPSAAPAPSGRPDAEKMNRELARLPGLAPYWQGEVPAVAPEGAAALAGPKGAGPWSRAVPGGLAAPGGAVSPPLAPARLTLHVAPEGDPAAPGTRARPLPGPEAALARLRELRASGAWAGGMAEIALAPGRYPLRAPLRITAADSDGQGRRLRLRGLGAPGAAVLDGGASRPLAAFAPVRDPGERARLAPGARDRALVADWPELRALPAPEPYGNGVASRRAVLVACGGRFLPPAAWPDVGYARAGAASDGPAPAVALPPPAAARAPAWAAARGWLAHGYWRYEWADAALPAGVAARPGGGWELRLLRPHCYGLAGGCAFRVLHLLAELDAPGEWHADREAGRFYWLPPPGATGEVRVALAPGPLVELDGARGVELLGLGFAFVRGSGLVGRGVEGLRVEGCDFRGCGGDGAELRGRDLVVCGCSFADCGHAALRLWAGERSRLVDGGARVLGCRFRRPGLAMRTYAPGLFLDGVGAVVAGCDFADMPSSAVRLEGNDHWLRGNRFSRVVLESDDQGAIDCWGDPSYRGNVIAGNLFADVGPAGGRPACGRAGVRLDDMISGTVVCGNVFVRAAQGNFGAVQIHGGQHNVVDANLFVDCAAAVSFTPWGTARWRRQLTEVAETRDKIHGAVEVGASLWRERYPELARLLEDADRNVITRNRCLRCPAPWRDPPETVEFWGNDEAAEER